MGFGCAVHVDDIRVLSEVLETEDVALGEDVADKEGISKGGDWVGGVCREELTHGGCQVSDGNSVAGHPFGQAPWVPDIVRCRNVDLRSKEKRSEDY